MTTRLLVVALGGIGCAGVLYLSVEGLYAVAQGQRARPSLLAQAMQATGIGIRRFPSLPPFERYLTDRRELESLLTQLRQEGITLGNTPYEKLATSRACLTYTDAEGITWNKPDLRVTSVQLRSRLFNNYDPIVINRVGPGTLWPPAAGELVARYGFREVVITTGADGDRTTLPANASEDVVLVIGDSMAMGMNLDDGDTLASQLQRRLPALRIVNAGVPGVGTRDNLAHLAARLRQYGPHARALVYFFSESDIEPTLVPADLLDAIEQLCRPYGVRRKVLIYGQYIYRTMPELMRATTAKNEQASDGALVDAMRYRQAMQRAAADRGLPVIDTFDLVQAYRLKEGSMFAGLALYVDHGHFSAAGLDLISAQAAPLLESVQDGDGSAPARPGDVR